jgi:hypothetical protein
VKFGATRPLPVGGELVTPRDAAAFRELKVELEE